MTGGPVGGPVGGTVQLSAARPMQALPYDPCPGDVAGVRALADACREHAAQVHAGERALGGWAPVLWSGECAHLAAQHLGDLAASGQDLRRSLGEAGEALAGWARRLHDLQVAADVLDAEAAEILRRRRELDGAPRELVLDPLAGLDVARALERDRLDRELGRVADRAGALHQEYVSTARTYAAMMDAAAPARTAAARWWRQGWDGVHDGGTHQVRRIARGLEWAATGSGAVAAGAGLVAVVAPPTAAVAAPVATAAGVGAAGALSVLSVGAGGSTEEALLAVASVVLPSATVLRLFGRAADDMARTAAWGGAGTEIDGWFSGHVEGTWNGAVPTGRGDRVAVTVHDVAQPWHVGTGWRGHGFAGLATVAVPRGRLPDARTTPAGTGSDERDDQDRVGGRRV